MVLNESLKALYYTGTNIDFVSRHLLLFIDFIKKTILIGKDGIEWNGIKSDWIEHHYLNIGMIIHIRVNKQERIPQNYRLSIIADLLTSLQA